MGIKGLTTYVKEHFNGWKTVNYDNWDHVIIDGNNVCYTLYKKNFPWALGGEYVKFSEKIKEFFKQFRNPIVVFDGAKFDLSKMETVRKRTIEYMGDLDSTQRQTHWRTDDTSTERILPVLLISTSIATLKEMGIECLVADGEADREMAALANHHNCPVLGSDSDLFIFNLKQGFIHFNRLYVEGKPDALFHIDDFVQQQKLKEYDFCLFIPAYFGNDIVKPKYERYYNYKDFFSELSKTDSCEDFFASLKGKDIPRSEFKSLKKYYSNLQWPIEKSSFPKNLPEWAYESYKTGNFSKELVDVCLNEACIMPRVVEVIKYESAWKFSRSIRQQLYHILGLSTVTEEIRRNSVPILGVEPVTAINCSASIKDAFFRGQNKKEMSTLVFNIMISQGNIKSEFDRLLDKWKLPAAATSYWYRNLPDPPSQTRGLLMSLLLSFLICSDDLPKKSFPFAPVTPATKEDHLKALHAFAQWQCVYHDAMSLNYLARAFPTTSPARLYSGEVVMYYAALCKRENWLDSVFVLQRTSGGIIAQHNYLAWQLFNDLLLVVTGRDKCGRVMP